MERSIVRQNAVYAIFKEEDPVVVAEVVARGCNRRHLSFLRWAGSGGMFPEAVEVLNLVAEQTPGTHHWITTRKPDVVELIKPRDNIFIGFSLDSTSMDRKVVVDKLNHPRVYYSFVRQYPEENTHNSAIIYNLQQKKKELSTAKAENGFVCPVDGGKMPVKGACARCRRCFSPVVLKNKSNN